MDRTQAVRPACEQFSAQNPYWLALFAGCVVYTALVLSVNEADGHKQIQVRDKGVQALPGSGA